MGDRFQRLVERTLGSGPRNVKPAPTPLSLPLGAQREGPADLEGSAPAGSSRAALGTPTRVGRSEREIFDPESHIATPTAPNLTPDPVTPSAPNGDRPQSGAALADRSPPSPPVSARPHPFLSPWLPSPPPPGEDADSPPRHDPDPSAAMPSVRAAPSSGSDTRATGTLSEPCAHPEPADSSPAARGSTSVIGRIRPVVRVESPTGRSDPQRPPSIQVTIGRIDVRAEGRSPAPAPPPPRPRRQPTLSLERYVAEREGGQR